MSLKLDLARRTATKYVTRTITDIKTKYVTKYRTKYVTRYLTRFRTVITALVTRYWLEGKVVTTIRTPTRIVVGESTVGGGGGGATGPVTPKLPPNIVAPPSSPGEPTLGTITVPKIPPNAPPGTVYALGGKGLKGQAK